MPSQIFSEVLKTAELLDNADPKWLTSKKEPDFITVEKGENGPPMLLLHGLFGALSNWDSVIPKFAEYSNPIALHFPLLTGHKTEVKVKALAAFTDFFVRKRKLQPAIICGNSLGGHVALRLALARPDMVDCLILSGSSGLYEHTVDSLPIRPGEKFVREHMSKVFYNQEFVTENAIQEIVDILKSKTRTLNLVHAAKSAKRDNMQNLLSQIKCPILLLWGENDTVTDLEVAETFHKLLPNSTLVTIPKCGHAPMIEHPQWFAEEVKKFLLKNSRLK